MGGSRLTQHRCNHPEMQQSRQNTQYFTLPNGLKIVCLRSRSKVDYFGIIVNSGSRDEAPGFHGLAHFVEHTIFKGTARRRASHIINRMEAVGGELNAFTSKEETTVYSIFPHGNLSRAVELIADLMRNSVFPAKELDKEREVVREEIDSYLDTPSEAVFDEFDNLFFKNSQLGHNILGEVETLAKFTPQACREYITASYTPDRMVAFYSGAMPPQRVADVINRRFGDMASPQVPVMRRTAPVPMPPFNIRRNPGTHQAHCVMGAAVPGIHSGERLPLGLITNILGGPGMNSRLNVALRERRGLVYTVDANLSMMSDCGLFSVYFGCDPDDAPRCAELVKAELNKIATQPLSPRALNAVKQQYLGQLAVASDNREQMALNAARATLFFGKAPDPAQTRDNILAITPDELLHAARHLLPSLFSTLTLG